MLIIAYYLIFLVLRGLALILVMEVQTRKKYMSTLCQTFGWYKELLQYTHKVLRDRVCNRLTLMVHLLLKATSQSISILSIAYSPCRSTSTQCSPGIGSPRIFFAAVYIVFTVTEICNYGSQMKYRRPLNGIFAPCHLSANQSLTVSFVMQEAGPKFPRTSDEAGLCCDTSSAGESLRCVAVTSAIRAILLVIFLRRLMGAMVCPTVALFGSVIAFAREVTRNCASLSCAPTGTLFPTNFVSPPLFAGKYRSRQAVIKINHTNKMCFTAEIAMIRLYPPEK